MRSRAAGPYRPELVERHWWPVALVLAVLVYVPVLLHNQADRIGDATLPLAAEPGTLLRRSLQVWDPRLGLGGIAEHRPARLWPAGPYLWLTDTAGIPDWVAQRFWTGSILFLAGAGVLYLCQSWRWRVTAGAAAAFTYTCTPFIALLTDRSALVLPLAGLPWLLGLTVEAMRRRGWRHPAAIALVLAAIAPAGILAVLAVAAVPAMWAVYAVVVTGDVRRPRAITTLAKIGALAVPVNLWWLLSLSVRWTNGLDVADALQGAARLRATATGPEVLRGLGHWLLYEPDQPSWVQGYTQDVWLIGLTFVVPVVAILALGVARWRYRTFAIGLVAVGLLLTTGTYHGGGAPPAGRLLAAAIDATSSFLPGHLAMAVPIVALGAALGVGSLVGAAAEEVSGRGLLGVGLVAAIAFASVSPLWAHAFAGSDDSGKIAPASLVHRLEQGGAGTRVLELTTGQPDEHQEGTLLEHRLDRRYAARTATATGSAPAADLLRALDTRVRDGTLGADALAPLARLLAAGDIVVRGPGNGSIGDGALGPAESFDDAITVVPVPDARSVVRTAGTEEVVLLSGDGMGIVDAADAGILSGDEVVRYSAEVTTDPDFLVTTLRDRRRLVVTDTNRERARRWTALRDVDGFTESIDGGLLRDDPADARLALPGDRPEARSVVEHRGLSARATSYGPDHTYRTDQRPAAAIDGDDDTAWMVESRRSNRGERLELRTGAPVRADEITILQADQPDTTAMITAVDVRFDDGDPIRIALDETSRQPPGQQIDIGDRIFSTLSIEIVDEDLDPGEGVIVRSGLAEVRVPGLASDDVVRMPTDLLGAAGFRSSRYPLDLVMTRVRAGADRGARADEETRIARSVMLPTQRAFLLRGTARPSPAAAPSGPPGACRDDIVAVDRQPVPVRVTEAGVGEPATLEGCEPVLLAGGDRLITTAPSSATGIAVDQLVLTSEPAAGTGAAPAPPTAPDGPGIAVERTSDTQISVRTDDAPEGQPFWLVLGESYDRGWSVLETETEIEVDGPHLIDGHANGFLVTPATADPVLTLRYVPQNRVDVGLLVSAVAVICALLLFLVPAPTVSPAPIPLQEPLRRLRAFTYEGALPVRRTAARVGLLALVLGLLFTRPTAAVVLAAIAGASTRRESWRPLLTVLPAVLVAAVGAHVVFLQADERIPAGPWWPALTDGSRVLAISAALLLVLDTVIEHIWRRNSHLQ